MAAVAPVCDFGWKAKEFRLHSTDGRELSLADVAGPRGTLIMFICNHCPYVKAALDRILRDARALQDLGIGVAAISSNDAEAYPQDSFAEMKALAEAKGFSFSYLYDESQDVARAYGAVCTPDFFGFDASFGLQYRGRLDAFGRNPAPPDARRELYEGMKLVAETGHGPADQVPSIGCSLKWKA